MDQPGIGTSGQPLRGYPPRKGDCYPPSRTSCNQFLSTKSASPQPGCGGCDNHSFVSAICGASKTVPLPITMKLVLIGQIEEAKELYWAKGPKDVRQDAPVMEYIRTNRIAAGTPRHERDRIMRRSRVYAFVSGELQRKLPNGIACIVPKPQDRVTLVKHMHEHHGHFGVRRTTSLIAPYYWWVGMGKGIAHVVQSCEECDRVNTSFNVQAKELQPLPVEGLFYR